MAQFAYNPTADQLNLKFACPNCGNTVEDFVGVPAPDLMAETHHDSINSDFNITGFAPSPYSLLISIALI